MAASMSTFLEFSSVIVCNNCLSWSEDNQIAIATEKGIVLYCLKFDPVNTSDKFIYQKCLIPVLKELPDMDVGVNRQLILGDKTNPSECANKVLLDKTLSEKVLSSLDLRSYSQVAWSPKGCDINGRSLLSSVSLDHRLVIWMVNKKHVTLQIVDLSQNLYHHMKDRWSSEDSTTDKSQRRSTKEIFQKFKQRKFSFAVIGLDWSAIFNIPITSSKTIDEAPIKRQKTDEAQQKVTSCVLLASRIKSGQIVFWKFEVPTITENNISIAAVIDTGYSRPTATAWCGRCRQGDTTLCTEDILAVGSLEGFISLWKVCFDEDGLQVCKVLDLWTEHDEIPVDALAWIYLKSSESRYILCAGKGQHLVAFNIFIHDGEVKMEQQIVEQSLHSCAISGICSWGSTIFSSSQDGSVQKVSFSSSDEGMTMDLKLLEGSRPLYRHMKGCALSPSGAFLATGLVCSPKFYFSLKSSVSVQEVIPREDMMQILLSCKVPVNRKGDCLDWVRRQYNSCKDLTLPQELQLVISDEFLEDVRNDKLVSLRLYLLQMCLSKAKYIAVRQKLDEIMADDIKMIEEKIKLTEENLILRHIINILGQSEPSVFSELTCLLMCEWLNLYLDSAPKHQQEAARLILIKFDKGGTSADREMCCLCKESIAFTSAVRDSCVNGHTWKRCLLSFRLCQQPSSRLCDFCGAISNDFRPETDTPWLHELLQRSCIFCGGNFVG